MYKLLLCWRYLRTRYIALTSIISVTLGVATMIVVNSVMQGFSVEMQNRIHGILSDVEIQPRDSKGMPNPKGIEARIRRVVGDRIEAVSPTVQVYAVLNGSQITQPVQLIGIDEKTQGSVSDFCKYLQHPANRKAMSFELREGGYDVRSFGSGPEAPERTQMAAAGWEHRRQVARDNKLKNQELKNSEDIRTVPVEQPSATGAPISDPFAAHAAPQKAFDPEKEQHTGAVLGIAIASYRNDQGEDVFFAVPGDDVAIGTFTAGDRPQVTLDKFTITDLYESKMNEYDSSFVFVPISRLQTLRGMFDPATNTEYVNSMMIKLKPGVDGDAVKKLLQAEFDPHYYVVTTWRDKQGPLLAAVQMEIRILNLLLFMIIAVAGFGILAIFFMIVVEKTRDIGILKSLGASGRGVMGIFLGYGLSLGIVGSGGGLVLGLLFVHYINQIAKFIGWVTGEPVFDPKIYYFYKIPAIVDPFTIAWIVAGALAIAVLASILPARRAARMHPVEALRYE